MRGWSRLVPLALGSGLVSCGSVALARDPVRPGGGEVAGVFGRATLGGGWCTRCRGTFGDPDSTSLELPDLGFFVEGAAGYRLAFGPSVAGYLAWFASSDDKPGGDPPDESSLVFFGVEPGWYLSGAGWFVYVGAGIGHGTGYSTDGAIRDRYSGLVLVVRSMVAGAVAQGIFLGPGLGFTVGFWDTRSDSVHPVPEPYRDGPSAVFLTIDVELRRAPGPEGNHRAAPPPPNGSSAPRPSPVPSEWPL